MKQIIKQWGRKRRHSNQSTHESYKTKAGISNMGQSGKKYAFIKSNHESNPCL